MKEETKLKKATTLINKMMELVGSKTPFNIADVSREIGIEDRVVSKFIKDNMIKEAPKVYTFTKNFSIASAEKSVLEAYKCANEGRTARRLNQKAKQQAVASTETIRPTVPPGAGHTIKSQTKLDPNYSPAAEVVNASKQEAAQAVAANTFVDKELDKADITIRISRRTKNATEAYEFTVGNKNMDYNGLINSLTSELRS